LQGILTVVSLFYVSSLNSYALSDYFRITQVRELKCMHDTMQHQPCVSYVSQEKITWHNITLL